MLPAITSERGQWGNEHGLLHLVAGSEGLIVLASMCVKQEALCSAKSGRSQGTQRLEKHRPLRFSLQSVGGKLIRENSGCPGTTKSPNEVRGH